VNVSFIGQHGRISHNCLSLSTVSLPRQPKTQEIAIVQGYFRSLLILLLEVRLARPAKQNPEVCNTNKLRDLLDHPGIHQLASRRRKQKSDSPDAIAQQTPKARPLFSCSKGSGNDRVRSNPNEASPTVAFHR
jgi:hypothetical protein